MKLLKNLSVVTTLFLVICGLASQASAISIVTNEDVSEAQLEGALHLQYAVESLNTAHNNIPTVGLIRSVPRDLRAKAALLKAQYHIVRAQLCIISNELPPLTQVIEGDLLAEIMAIITGLTVDIKDTILAGGSDLTRIGTLVIAEAIIAIAVKDTIGPVDVGALPLIIAAEKLVKAISLL